jgi:hypothetical protein
VAPRAHAKRPERGDRRQLAETRAQRGRAERRAHWMKRVPACARPFSAAGPAPTFWAAASSHAPSSTKVAASA